MLNKTWSINNKSTLWRNDSYSLFYLLPATPQCYFNVEQYNNFVFSKYIISQMLEKQKIILIKCNINIFEGQYVQVNMFINVPSFLQKEQANDYILEFISFWEYIFSSSWINIMFFQIMTSCIRHVDNKKLNYLNVRDTWNFAWNKLAMKSKLESTTLCNFLSCNSFLFFSLHSFMWSALFFPRLQPSSILLPVIFHFLVSQK